MIPVHQSPLGHLNNARVIAHGLSDGYLAVDAVHTLRLMLMDIRDAVYRETGGSPFSVVDVWLAQAMAIIDPLIYGDRPRDDLDLGALKECLTEAACALRVWPMRAHGTDVGSDN